MTAPLGTVLERDGSVYRVATPAGEIRAVLSGKAKREAHKVVVGDVVRLEPEPGGALHAIVGIEPRRTVLERRVPEGRGTFVDFTVEENLALGAYTMRDKRAIRSALDYWYAVAASEWVAANGVMLQYWGYVR